MCTLPPPYHTLAVSLQGQSRDVASLIRKLSQDIVRTDEAFHQVSVLLEGKQNVAVSSSALKNDWINIQKIFHSIIWLVRRTATEVEVRNGDFIEVIVPVVADTHESKEGKIAELKAFLEKPPPKFLTSSEVSTQLEDIRAGLDRILKKYNEDADTMVASAINDIEKLEAEREKQKAQLAKSESLKTSSSSSKATTSPSKAKPSSSSYGGFFSSKKPESTVENVPEPIDYDAKIALAKSMVETVNKQRDAVSAKVTEIKQALATIPDEVGTCFSTVWTHLTTEATHLRNRLQGSTTDPLPDFRTIERVYTEINAALKYYATNVNKLHT